MKLKEGFVLRDVCGEQGDFSVDSLTDALCEEYDVSREQAIADVNSIVGEWKKVGVVE